MSPCPNTPAKLLGQAMDLKASGCKIGFGKQKSRLPCFQENSILFCLRMWAFMLVIVDPDAADVNGNRLIGLSIILQREG